MLRKCQACHITIGCYPFNKIGETPTKCGTLRCWYVVLTRRCQKFSKAKASHGFCDKHLKETLEMIRRRKNGMERKNDVANKTTITQKQVQ